MNGSLDRAEGSLVARLNPVVRFVGALAFAAACFCAESPALLGLLLAVGFFLAALAGVLRKSASVALATAAFSALLALVQLLTVSEGEFLVGLPWGYIGTGSVQAAASTVARLVAAAVPLYVVLSATDPTDLSNAAVKVLHVPYRYAFTFSSAIRFVPLFMDDMRGIVEAQTARGVRLDAAGPVRRLRLMVPLAVPLLVASVRKTNSAAIAAEVRGFNLRTRESGYKSYPLGAGDAAAAAVVFALLAVAVAW